MKGIIATNTSLLGCGLRHLQAVSRESRDGNYVAKLRTPSPKPEVEKKAQLTRAKRDAQNIRSTRSEVAMNRRKTNTR